MRRYLGIAALSLALAFGLSISNASALGFGYPEEFLAEQSKGTDHQYRVLDPVEGDGPTIEEIIETVGAAGE